MASSRGASRRIDPQTVKGWGVDADPRNDPTYPYRERSGQEERGLSWERPPLQKERLEVLRSVEHNRMPAVFGTSVPPRGISGRMRRGAFHYSESDWRHWLILLAADRVNMVEGLVQDLFRGHIPDVPGEMGIRAEWQHNRAGLMQKAAVVAIGSAVVLALLKSRNHRSG